MGALLSLIAVIVLALVPLVAVGAGDLRYLVGVIVPGVAFAVFLVGIVVRLVQWARVPVPFRIPATCGQQKTLPWMKHDELDNPSSGPGVLVRMALEVLAFRSLFRNTRAEVNPGKEKVSYIGSKYLWAGAMLFHWSMLVVVLRHYRFFVEPVPTWVFWLQAADGFFQVGVPVIYATSVGLFVALLFLLWRRVADPQVRFVSLPTDYFALYLLLGIVISGGLMRHFEKVDIVQVKAAIAGWASLDFFVPEGVGILYFVHVFLVSVLLLYFPFSKLLHMPGVFLSPTRNQANTNRARRHVNPWNPPIVGHTYAEWEEEFHDKLVAAGYPLDKE